MKGILKNPILTKSLLQVKDKNSKKAKLPIKCRLEFIDEMVFNC